MGLIYTRWGLGYSVYAPAQTDVYGILEWDGVENYIHVISLNPKTAIIEYVSDGLRHEVSVDWLRDALDKYLGPSDWTTDW